MARVREPPGEQDAEGMEADGAHNRANFPLAPSSLPLFRTTPTVPNFLTVDLTRTGSRKAAATFRTTLDGPSVGLVVVPSRSRIGTSLLGNSWTGVSRWLLG